MSKHLTPDLLRGVTAHLLGAQENLIRKQSPDHHNSIKELISGVESLAKELAGNSTATFRDAHAVLEKKNDMHPALRKALLSLYGSLATK